MKQLKDINFLYQTFAKFEASPIVTDKTNI